MKKFLLIPIPDFQLRVDDCFQLIQNDAGIKSNFLNNPVEYLLSQLFPDIDYEYDTVQISSANRLCFSVLANDDFRNWLSNYETTLINNMVTETTYILDRQTILIDLTNAILQYGDQNIVYSFIQAVLNCFRWNGFLIIIQTITKTLIFYNFYFS